MSLVNIFIYNSRLFSWLKILGAKNARNFCVTRASFSKFHKIKR